jgi:hypothetical protein
VSEVVGLNGSSMNEAHPERDDEHWPPMVDSWLEPERDKLNEERSRLEREIAAAKARAEAARRRTALREEDMRASMRAELSAAQQALADMERQHEATLAMVKSTAQAEIDRILAEARRDAGGVDHVG